MPAEPTKSKLKRRSSRKDLDEYRFDTAHARELELKRSRGEVSCAECRRLKIKCDKQIPCQSCQRRGCAALCPNGSLATGQGTRFVLAATEHLHRKIASLSGRIRQLEDALATLQARHSDEPHPLLHEDLVHSEEKDEETPFLGEIGGAPAAPDMIESFGTLSISDHGVSRFFGPTGGSESLLIANLNSRASTTTHTPEPLSDDSPTCPPELSLFSHAFPFTPLGHNADVQQLIESHLPPWEQALSLCGTYIEQASWLFRGVTRAQLMDDMLPVIYKKSVAEAGEDYGGPHDLALLFVIFAIGALVQAEPSNAQAEHFYQISRAALALQPVLEKPSIVTIQNLHLLSIYNAMSGSDLKNETSMEMTWSLITLAAHLSQTIGLHRDSARWGLSPKMVQRRRILFWDLFVADVWQSLNTGRPPSFSLPYIDCSYPQYGKDDKEGGFGSAFEVWQCRFAAECVAEVTAKTLTAEAPSYATIMELDRKVREFPLPEGFSANPQDLGASFQRCVLDHIRETVLMYIHRSFFAQAIIEHPANPLKSAYAPSFLAAYRASSTILKSVREQFNIWPNTCARFWTMWTFAFSAAVVLGTVVTRGPRSPLASAALTELEHACLLFSKASVYSIRAAKALPILSKLSEKARYALATAQKDPSPLSGDKGGLLWNINREEVDDELSILAGHTRFVSATRHTVPLVVPSSHPVQQPQEPVSPTSSYGSSDGPSSQLPTSQPSIIPAFSGHVRRQASQPSLNTATSNWSSQPQPRQTDYMPLTPAEDGPVSYGYITSNRAEQQQLSAGGVPSYSWVSDSSQQSQPPQSQPYRPVPLSSGLAPHYTSNYHQAPPPQLHAHPLHPSRPVQTSAHQVHLSNNQMYATTPAFHPHDGAPRNPELAHLGLASRDSRLDERWNLFMEDSGILDGTNFRGHGP
ncbi:hypothetical protein AX16_002778 [Volvariella volvacea WC 439]|nr:hypothetical protein AX16_002778 [Volvariella volvacea WC 439]